MGVLSYVTSCFSLVAFKILPLTFAIFIMTCHGVGLFGFILFGTDSLCYLGLDVCFFPQVREIFSYFFKYIFCPFLFPFWVTCSVNVSTPDVVPRSLKLSSFFKIPSLFSVWLGWFVLFCLPDRWSILLYDLICHWFPPLVYSSALIGSFLYFLTPRSSPHCSYIFLLSLVSSFMIIILNSVSGTLLVSISFSSFSQVFVMVFCLKHTPLSPNFA